MSRTSDLLAGKSVPQKAAAPPSNVLPLAPKVASAHQALLTETQKVKSQIRNSPKAKSRTSELLATADKISQGKKGDGFDFSWNPIKLVGEITQNVPAIDTALKVLDTPRAAVTSAVKELVVDPTTGHGGPSLGDFIGQLGLNNHVGFGDLEEQANPDQNIWVKRLIGIAGDVAADPLTYATGGAVNAAGAVSKGAATLDRVELAQRAAAAAEKGVKGITDAEIAAIGRKGITGVAPEIQRALGARPVLTVAGVPVKGSEPAMAALRATTGKVRQVLGDTALGKAARGVGVSTEEAQLVENVVKGGDKAAESAKALEAIAQKRAISRQFGAVQGKALTDILKKAPKSELKTLARDVENGVTTGTAGKVRDFLDQIKTEANARGANINDLGTDYFPHQLTDQAAEALAEQGVRPKANVAGTKGPEFLRTYKPGEDFMGEPLLAGSAEEINAIANKNLGYDLFKTNPAEVLPAYVQQAQQAVARGAFANRLVEHGVAQKIGTKAEVFAGESGKTLAEDVSRQSVDGLGKGALASFKKISHDTVAPDWLHDAVQAKAYLGPSNFRAFTDSWNRFTNLWKAGATFSPGFHVRNAYSGMFNNFVAGVKTAVYPEEQRLARLAEKGALHTAEDKAAWDYVQKAVEATGNPFDPAEIGRAAKPTAHKIIGKPGRISRSAGNFVENHLRGAMALDSYKAGDDLATAINRIERFHFNYADVSAADRGAKMVIPFWMFTSRNLPLQLQMLLRRPGAYTKYLSFKNNLGLDVPTDQVVPGYFGEQQAIPTDLPLPGGTGTKYLAPDLPFLRVNKDLQMLTDPVRLISEANPLIKLPVEALAGKKLFNDAPFTDKYQEIPAVLKPFAPLMKSLGLAKEGADGKTMSTDKQLYILESLIPLVGRGRRLVPSEDQYSQRLGTSLLSTLGGISSLTNTPSAQAGELAGRKAALEDFIKTQQELGFVPKPSTKSTKKPFGKRS